MAVSYTSNIYTQERLFFIKLLFRWSGSVWQLLWVDFLVFVAIYMILAAVYQNILFDYQGMKQTFEVTVKWIGQIRTSVPLSFMLGFFVSTVISRWWNTCMAIPWLHGPSFYSQAIVDTSKAAKSDIARKIRITVLRYLNLSWILLMGEISSHIKQRFGFWRPKKKEYELTWQKRIDLINADTKVQKYFGALVTEEERMAFGRSAELSSETDLSYSPEYWLPLVWGTRLLRRARNIGLIVDERAYLFMVEMIANFRVGLGTVWTYSEFNIPLVYTQVAVAAVYIFLMASLVSTQLTENDFINPTGTLSSGVSRNASDIPDAVQILVYIPIIGSLEFIFYLGWFKIGVCLLNSLGKDKADLPLSDILNSNLKASVKLGGAEDTIFPIGLTDNGQPEEEQIAEFLRSFDFNEVHAHDKFGSAEETERQLRRALLKRLQGKTAAQKQQKQLLALPEGSGKSSGSKDSGLQSRMDYLNLDTGLHITNPAKVSGKVDKKEQQKEREKEQKQLKAQQKQQEKALKPNGAMAFSNGKAKSAAVSDSVTAAPTPPSSPTARDSPTPSVTAGASRPSATIESAVLMLRELATHAPPEEVRLRMEADVVSTGETSRL